MKKKTYWPSWRYGPEDGQEQIFDRPEDVPEGWFSTRAEAIAYRDRDVPPAAPASPTPAATRAPRASRAQAPKVDAAEARRQELLVECRAIWPDTPDEASTVEMETNLNNHRAASTNGDGS